MTDIVAQLPPQFDGVFDTTEALVVRTSGLLPARRCRAPSSALDELADAKYWLQWWSDHDAPAGRILAAARSSYITGDLVDDSALTRVTRLRR